jgi:protein kinase A
MDIRDHPWFKIINVERLLKRRWPAPWVPDIKNGMDASHFESYAHLEAKRNKDPVLKPDEQDLFKDF